jgi:hypothetical protein
MRATVTMYGAPNYINNILKLISCFGGSCVSFFLKKKQPVNAVKGIIGLCY